MSIICYKPMSCPEIPDGSFINRGTEDGSGEPSRVLRAVGYEDELARASLRFSLSERNTQQDIEYILEKLPPILDMLKSKSHWGQ